MHSIEKLSELVGTSHKSVCGLRVEPGKVAEFARAVGYDDPLFFGREQARKRGYDAIPAPPTFTRVWQFPRHQPNELTGYRGFDLGVGLDTIHGEQRYEYHRPLLVGDVLSGETTLVEASIRSESLTRVVLETEYNANGEDVVTERTTLLATEAGEMEAPSGSSARVTENALSRLDFVQYAGASGDFTPYHVNEEAANMAGYPSVFGQGMLTAGHVACSLVDTYGLKAIRSLQTRFVAPVWPGDELWIDITEPRNEAKTDIIVTVDDDRTVLTGVAVIDGRS